MRKACAPLCELRALCVNCVSFASLLLGFITSSIQTGRNYRTERGADSPHFTYWLKYLCPPPSRYLIRWEPSVCVFDLSYCFATDGFRIPYLSGSRLSALLARSNAYLHHTGNLCGGNPRPECLSLLCHSSYSSFRRWRDSNPQPLMRSNSRLHHAASFFKSAHTSSISAKWQSIRRQFR